jgi:hypothetical protein
MIENLIKAELQPVVRRRRWLRVNYQLALCWIALAAAGLVLDGRLVVAAAIVSAVVILFRARDTESDYREMARRIEQENPELRALLLTALEQSPADGYLQRRVIQEAIEESRKSAWLETIPRSRLHWAQAGQLAALGLLALVALQPRGTRFAQTVTTKITVTPGDIKLERGNSLLVLARFTGPLPATANLVINSHTIPLIKSLNDPVFAASVPEVTSDLTYRIEYGARRTRDFKVTVFEHPKLERADADLNFPSYTGLPAKHISDTRRISAVEDTRLDLTLQLNKPVKSAKLVARDKTEIPLTTDLDKPVARLKQFRLGANKTYDLHLVDADGRANKVPAQFVFEAHKNRAPELKIAAPRGDQRPSPLEEIAFQAESWDDFGLRAFGLAYTFAGQEPKFIELGKETAAAEKRTLSHLLKLEDLGAQPDQLISWYFWADDVGPDGKVRRTSSDMYFAEVRPFEEIYRQGQPKPDGEQSGSGNKAQKLAELQKQIINATWKLQRQQPPTPEYKKDAPVVRDSQAKALEQAEAMKEQAANPRSQALMEAVEKEMQQALDQLKKATESPAPLPTALTFEQAAYQALLKLAAHEFSVTQSRNRRGNSGEQQGQQRQLEQLDLKMSEDRYESKRQAKPMQNPEQREQLQVLNRLQELARRQQDLNERLKELQNALQAAKTEAEREEIRRRLKRLREEEQEMLADVDELRQRMDRPENQQRMADARKQLEQTRQEVQRAAEAMQREAASQALASGTRAQRDLQQMRDEFRKKNSRQFSEEMRQMRQDARDLAQKQEDITKKLQDVPDPRQKSLSAQDQKSKLAQQLDDQKQRMAGLLDDAAEVTKQAEPVEPLLSKQLYDTIRKNNQEEARNLKETTRELMLGQRVNRSLYEMLQQDEIPPAGRSLEIAGEMVRQDMIKQARKTTARAGENVEQLKKGIERAAESVLGDETEALKMARKQLDDLEQQLNKEIAKNELSYGQERRRPGGFDRDFDRRDGGTPLVDGRGTRFFDRGGERDMGRGPILGEDYAEWTDRLRDVEEMLEQPALRNDVARVRERARQVRTESRRNATKPDWAVVKLQIAKPLRDVRDKISEELARREPAENLVPIDRDPVPAKFSKQVQHYYEELGKSR